MGGAPVLGYEVNAGGGLQIHAREAQQVRAIFELVAEASSWESVLRELSRSGWTTKQWVSRSGRQHPGRAFRQSDLLRLVRSVTYLGKVRCEERTYQGEHQPVVGSALWDQAQAATDRLQRRRAAGPRNGANLAAVPPAAVQSFPRITRLLALALKMEEMLQRGVVANYAELARLGQVSPARITQIMNLLNLAPDIKEQILFLNTGACQLSESIVRKLGSIVLWSEQREQWRRFAAALPERK